MKTKNLFSILLGMTILTCLSGCKSDETTEAKPVKELLIVEKETIIGPSDTRTEMEIVADCQWTITEVDNEKWEDLTISPLSGNGNTTLTLFTDKNYYSVNRTATVTITTGGGMKQTVSICQSLSDAELSINQEEFSFDEEGGILDLVVSSNSSWEITGLANIDWVELERTSGSAGVTAIPISVKNVFGDDDRSVLLTISSNSTSAEPITFIIYQKGRTIINLSANNELSTFLYDGGSKTLSLSCNADWYAYIPSSAKEWLQIEPASGSGDGEIHVTCTENPDERQGRETTLIVVAGTKNPQQLDINVRQYAYPTNPNVDDNPEPSF